MEVKQSADRQKSTLSGTSPLLIRYFLIFTDKKIQIKKIWTQYFKPFFT